MYDSRERFTRKDSVELCTMLPYGDWRDHNGNIIEGPIFYYPFPTQKQQVFFEARSLPVPGGKKDWKPFMHYKRAWNDSQFPPIRQLSTLYRADTADYRVGHYLDHADPYCGYRAGFGGNAGKYQPWLLATPMFDPVADSVFIPEPADLSNLTQRALNSTMPRIKAELSLINSLIELKDFTSVKPSLELAAGTAKSILGSISKKVSSSSSFNQLTVRQLLRTAGDNFLQWKFNIAPLISDIASIHRALSLTYDRIIRNIRQAQQWKTAHFTCPVVEEDLSSSRSHSYDLGPSSTWDPPIISCKTNVTASAAVSMFHVEIRYCYSYWKFQEENALLLAYLDALGVNFNPKIVWNAIPFSFLVDWVVNINNFLDKFALRFMDPVIVISDYLWSITRKRIVNADYQINAGVSSEQAGPRRSMPTVTETAYRRDCKMPSLSSFTTSGLSSDELSLGSALLATRGRGHRHHRNR